MILSSFILSLVLLFLIVSLVYRRYTGKHPLLLKEYWFTSRSFLMISDWTLALLHISISWNLFIQFDEWAGFMTGTGGYHVSE